MTTKACYCDIQFSYQPSAKNGSKSSYAFVHVLIELFELICSFFFYCILFFNEAFEMRACKKYDMYILCEHKPSDQKDQI